MEQSNDTNDDSTPLSSRSIHHDLVTVPLHTVSFQKYLERHLDESKPDPLANRQMQSWTLEWHDLPHCPENDSPKHGIVNQLHGNLDIHGEHHLVVTLHATRSWTVDSLSFHLTAIARVKNDDNDDKKRGEQETMITSDVSTLDENSNNTTIQKKKPCTKPPIDRITQKINAGIHRRWNEHKYVRRLLSEECLLCEAHVVHKTTRSAHQQQQNGNNDAVVTLEERVWVDDTVLEGLQTCLYSHAETTLDVMEWIVNLPYLPMEQTPLAHRAKLRLLEDVMVDACEKVGDDDLLEELNIHGDNGDGDRHDDKDQTDGDKETFKVVETKRSKPRENNKWRATQSRPANGAVK